MTNAQAKVLEAFRALPVNDWPDFLDRLAADCQREARQYGSEIAATVAHHLANASEIITEELQS
jgi:hypothetical protein